MIIASHGDFEAEIDEGLEACLDSLSVRIFECVIKDMLTQLKNTWLPISTSSFDGSALKYINFLWTDCPLGYD